MFWKTHCSSSCMLSQLRVRNAGRRTVSRQTVEVWHDHHDRLRPCTSQSWFLEATLSSEYKIRPYWCPTGREDRSTAGAAEIFNLIFWLSTKPEERELKSVIHTYMCIYGPGNWSRYLSSWPVQPNTWCLVGLTPTPTQDCEFRNSGISLAFRRIEQATFDGTP